MTTQPANSNRGGGDKGGTNDRHYSSVDGTRIEVCTEELTAIDVLRDNFAEHMELYQSRNKRHRRYS